MRRSSFHPVYLIDITDHALFLYSTEPCRLCLKRKSSLSAPCQLTLTTSYSMSNRIKSSPFVTTEILTIVITQRRKLSLTFWTP
ncbi:hypothetical protein KOW79_010200 [Hemibagrus wyckioides]|uniref:Uncharacterized protein n=1 Tax=Hemibagrus wyckioides TaxID=337641 RepID=A0A9D3NQR2_9TELE|nr:hypothetical protein KOW79_010200 [Hemibagrus wyckioides]